MNRVFIGCPSRLGHTTLTGPKTKKQLVITPQGSWIDSIDWHDELENEKIPYFCFKTRSMKTARLYEISPSARQMEEVI